MHILALEAENFKRLKAVNIVPNGEWQVIGGRNAQGKTSVLDAIWSALGGGKASPEKPIRDGEENAIVRLDLGDLWVTRTWTSKGTQLKVEGKDGAEYKSPQALLDKLIGQLGFDPLAFTRLAPRQQREELLRLVDLPIDLDVLDARRAELYESRTVVGREGKALGDVEVDQDLPTEEQSASELVRIIQEKQENNRDFREWQDYSTRTRDNVMHLETRIHELEEQLEAEQAKYREALAKVDAMGGEEDTSELEHQLATVEERNQQIRANNKARETVAQQQELRERYDQLTADIKTLDTQKADALAKAEFPVNGLGFNEKGVTYNGLPLEQASSAEQIRVSLAIGMAFNPKLRVLMIKDGSLLDQDTMASIRAQVAEKGFQIWVERVGDADEGAVIIEDGEQKQ